MTGMAVDTATPVPQLGKSASMPIVTPLNAVLATAKLKTQMSHDTGERHFDSAPSSRAASPVPEYDPITGKKKRKPRVVRKWLPDEDQRMSSLVALHGTREYMGSGILHESHKVHFPLTAPPPPFSCYCGPFASLPPRPLGAHSEQAWRKDG